MSIESSKEAILEQNNYRYNFDRMIYFNRTTKKVFSYEAIDDHDEEWLLKCIREENNGQWQFYFNGPQPDEAIKNEIISEFTC